MRRWLLLAGLLVLVAVALIRVEVLTGPTARIRCDAYASPAGSDSGSGQVKSPLRSVQALDYALAPGQTGCLLGGTYGGFATITYLGNSGTTGSQITITAAPGQTAKVTGLVELEA